MKNRKRLVSVLAGVMAAVLLLTLLMSILPTFAGAASSGEIRKQIIALQQERKEVQNQIADVKKQYKENENEIADLIAKKNVIDQEIQLLNTQIININEQISAYNLLIADKQDELDTAEDRLETLNQENKDRIRTMEEEGEVSYWEVVFKANSFSDLLDRLNMVEEIAASDKRRLQELSDAANKVEEAQAELEAEKVELEDTKKDLDDTQAEMNEKNKESEALLQELLQKADDLQALEEECKEQENAFLKQIAAMEVQFNAAKQREWEAWKATSVPPTTHRAAAAARAVPAEIRAGTPAVRPEEAAAAGWFPAATPPSPVPSAIVNLPRRALLPTIRALTWIPAPAPPCTRAVRASSP